LLYRCVHSFKEAAASRTEGKRTALFWVITQQVMANFSDVSGQPIGPIFMVQEYALRNNPEEGGSHLLRGGNLKPRKQQHASNPQNNQLKCYYLCGSSYSCRVLGMIRTGTISFSNRT